MDQLFGLQHRRTDPVISNQFVPHIEKRRIAEREGEQLGIQPGQF